MQNKIIAAEEVEEVAVTSAGVLYTAVSTIAEVVAFTFLIVLQILCLFLYYFILLARFKSILTK